MLIRQGQMARLRRKLGPKPDEGQVFIRTNDKVRDGAGWKTVSILDGPLPARISFDPENRTAERVAASQPMAQHRYLVELSAEVAVVETQEILWAGVPWVPSQRYLAGTRLIPTNPNGKVYYSLTEGSVADLEPDWPILLGDTINDGDVTWKCIGDYAVLQIIEIAKFESYAITRDVYCDLRS